MPLSVPCDVCGDPLPGDAPYQTLRHSGECHRAHERRRIAALRERYRAVIDLRTCQACGGPFEVPRTSIRRYCAPACHPVGAARRTA